MLQAMSSEQPPWPARSPTIDELVLADEPERWAALGFDVADDVVQLGSVRLRLAGEDAGRGIVGWSLRARRLDASSTACATDALATPRRRAPAPAHPTGSSRSTTSSR